MKLARVRIQNFRSIQEAEFAVPDMCALIGSNNSGKSNVLNAIDLVLGERWPTVRSVSDQDIYGYDEARDLSITLWFDGKREVPGDVGDPAEYSGIRFSVTRYKIASGRHTKGDLRTEFLCVDKEGEPVFVLRRMRGAARPARMAATVTQAIRDELPAVMVDVDRNMRHHLSGSQWSILGRLLRGISKRLKADKVRYEEFLRKFGEARKVLHTEEYNTLQSTIVEHIQRHTGLKGVEVELDSVDPINIYKSFSLLFKDPDSPKPVDADRMGSGIQSAVVISLLQAYRELHKANAILLFEEPELYLHPHGRRYLYRLLCDLAKQGTQVVYTTHSEDFVDLSRIDGVRVVSKAAEEGTKLKQPTEGPLEEEWRRKLRTLHHLCGSRNEVFFADSVVLVEGITEQAAVRMLSEMMPKPLSLDQLNCSVIEAAGKPNLPMFIRIVLALGKRVLVVYDRDSHLTSPEAKEANEKRNKSIEKALDAEGAEFVFDPYLEDQVGIPDTSKRGKEDKMRRFLQGLNGWSAVPKPLQDMMEAVARLAKGEKENG